MDKTYDLIVVGAGPAGITASVYAARKKMDLLVLTDDIGGQTAWSGDIENYTGYRFITGIELTAKLEDHIKQYGIEVHEGEPVTAVEKSSRGFRIVTAKSEYFSRTVIVASGKKPKKLNVPGEDKFRSKGLAYCATCDAPLFAGKHVAVIGGGNTGLEAALQLVKIASKVYIVNIAPRLTGDAVMSEKLTGNDKVTVMNNSRVVEVMGDKFVHSVAVENEDGREELSVQGVFVEIGLDPNTNFRSDLDLNAQGEIKVTHCNETNIPGLFAAGDVTEIPEKQIIIAAGEGAKAALRAFNFISRS